MRVSVLRSAGDLVVEERPEPVPGPYDVLVWLAAVGVCGSDVHYFEHGRIGSHVVEAPMILGHEASGEVVGAGSEVSVGLWTCRRGSVDGSGVAGIRGEQVALPVSRIQERELTLTGTFRYAHTWPAAIALATSGRAQLDTSVTGHDGLDQVREALTVARTDPQVVKPVVRPAS